MSPRKKRHTDAPPAKSSRTSPGGTPAPVAAAPPGKAQPETPPAVEAGARPPHRGRAPGPQHTPAAAPGARAHVLAARAYHPVAAAYRPVEATRPPQRTPADTLAGPPAAAPTRAPQRPRPAVRPDADGPGRTELPSDPEAPLPSAPETPLPSGPEAAFDALYIRSAGPLLRQVELLTGDPAFAGHAVVHAFDLAWQRWPEVAQDSDPVGWVRAAAYEYALAPWQRWLPGAGHRPQPRAADGSLEAALLDLPPAHRRALLLYDGVGLDLPDAAAEVEASTLSTAARITRAREELSAAVPESAEPLATRLSTLLDDEPEPPREPAGVRDASERGARHRTTGAFALTGLIAAATLVVVVAGPGTGHHSTPRQPDAPVTSSPHAADAPAYVPPFTPPANPLVAPGAGSGVPPAGPPWAPLAPVAATPPATPRATGTAAAAPAGPRPHPGGLAPAGPTGGRSPAGAAPSAPAGAPHPAAPAARPTAPVQVPAGAPPHGPASVPPPVATVPVSPPTTAPQRPDAHGQPPTQGPRPHYPESAGTGPNSRAGGGAAVGSGLGSQPAGGAAGGSPLNPLSPLAPPTAAPSAAAPNAAAPNANGASPSP